MPSDNEMESPTMELLDDLDLDVSGHSHIIEAQIEHFLDTFKKQGLSPWHDSCDSVDTIGLVIPRRRTLVRSSSDSSYYSTETSPSVEDEMLSGLVRDPSCSTNCTFTSFVSSAASEANYIKSFLDYVMGDISCRLTVLDVAQALQEGYACITGGKSLNGACILTFPDRTSLREISDEEYKNLITYLTSIPTLQDSDLGFVIVLDRRLNGWSSVKTLLLRISGFFPGLVQEVLVLRPTGFFQRHVTDMGYKMVKDEFKFAVHLLNSVEELYTHLDKSELSKDVGGELEYDHNEWVQQRCAVEKFSMNTHEISQALRELCERIQETEFPNDVTQTEGLMRDHQNERRNILDDLVNTMTHGEILLKCFKSIKGDGDGDLQSTSQLPPCKQLHITAIERLLLQLEETKSRFNDFWEEHESKLRQCLELRKFEEDFKQLQYAMEQHISVLEGMQDPASSLEKMDMLSVELDDFEKQSNNDITRAEKLDEEGQQLIADRHYAMDCIQPKCVELQRICTRYRDLLETRGVFISRYKDLQDRLDKANKWCGEGVDLLASQQIDRLNTTQGAESAMNDIDMFVSHSSELGLSDPKEFRILFTDVVNDDVNVVVQTVLKRIADVEEMCQKRRNSLKKITNKQVRPVQPVSPEPAHPTPTKHDEHHKKKKSHKATIEVIRTDDSDQTCAGDEVNHKVHSPTSSVSTDSIAALQETDILHAKRGHVMKELIDTERVYVQELKSILQGYADQMDVADMKPLLPPQLVGQKEALFGNMQQIYDFHNRIFLKDLENCLNTPALVGKCFVERKEKFQMYSVYCQNKPRSEALRREAGDNNPFFKECWKTLGHKLPLSAYLLKPVQRITKYQLLLKEMVKYTEDDSGYDELKEAVDTMLQVLKYVNDAMNQLAVIGFKGNLSDQGRLLTQDSFIVRVTSKKDKLKRLKPAQRHIFLYEKLVLLCKRKEDHQALKKSFYYYKNALETATIGLTESVKGDSKKFELWSQGRSQVFVIQSRSVEIKNKWVMAIKNVLLMQFDHIRERSRHISDVSAVPINSLGGGVVGDYPNGNNNMDELAEEEGYEGDDWATHDLSDDDMLDDSYDTQSSGSQSSAIQLTALTEYTAQSESELTLKEGDVVEVVKHGSEGWVYVSNISTAEGGWVPKAFLEQCKHRSQSDMSVCSAESGMNGLKTCTSRTSVVSQGSVQTESNV